MIEKFLELLRHWVWSLFQSPTETPAGESFGKSWIVLHHWYGEPTSREEALRLSLAEGYSDIPYNYVITRKGELWKGRPDNSCAANLGINSRALAICFLGNFEGETPTRAQLYTARDLIKTLLRAHPRAKLILHKDVSRIVPRALYRGRWVSTATACPGALFVSGRYGAILWQMVNGLSFEEAQKKVRS